MPVRSIARGTDQLVTAAPDATATSLARAMDDDSVGSVVIVEDDEPVGIVTDRDLALSVLMEGRDGDTPAAEFMTRDLVTVHAEAGVMELCRTMREHGVRRLPVVDDGRLTGIVTLDDVVVLLQGEMENITEVIRTESPPY
jgi:CBS domain-containing protein